MAILDVILSRAHDSLGANSAWLSWIGGSVIADGKGRMHLHEVAADTDYPFAKLDWSYNLSFTLANMGDDTLQVAGTFHVTFVDEIGVNIGEEVAYNNFLNNCTNVLHEFLLDADDNLPITKFRCLGITRTDEEHREESDALVSLWEIEIDGEPTP